MLSLQLIVRALFLSITKLITQATNDICFWNATYSGTGSPTFLYNGLYRYVSNLNNKPYYKIDRSALDCTDPYFYIFYDIDTNKWTLDTDIQDPFPRAICPQTGLSSPTDCDPNTWRIGGSSSFQTDIGASVLQNIIDDSNSCPSLQCTSITVTDTHPTITGCTGTFDQIGYNKFQKSGTDITWYFNIPYFNWLCVDTQYNTIPNTITGNCKQAFSYGPSAPGRVMKKGFDEILASNGGLDYVDPNNKTFDKYYHVEFTCNGNGNANYLTRQPTSPNPTFNPIPDPTNIPTTTPTTSEPSVSPTKAPTMIPSVAPTPKIRGDYCARFGVIPLETCYEVSSSSQSVTSYYYQCDENDPTIIRQYWWQNENCSGEFPSYYTLVDCTQSINECYCGGDPDKCDIGTYISYQCDAGIMTKTKTVLNACKSQSGSSSTFSCDSTGSVKYNSWLGNDNCNGEIFEDAYRGYLNYEKCGTSDQCGSSICNGWYYESFCNYTGSTDAPGSGGSQTKTPKDGNFSDVASVNLLHLLIFVLLSVIVTY